MPKKYSLSLLLALFFVLTAPAVRAMDLYWETTTVTTISVDGQTRELGRSRSSHSLKDNLLRVDKNGESQYWIYNFHRQVAVFVAPKQKIFAEFSFRELAQKVRDDRSEVKKNLDRRENNLESLPPDARKMTKAKIDAQRKKYELWSGRYRVTKAGEQETVSGHPCVKYKGISGNREFQEIWVAEDIKVDSNYKIYYARRMRMIDRQENSHLALVNGFPMKTVSHYGPITVTKTVTHVSEHKIPAKAYILSEDLKPPDSAVKPH